MKSNHYGSQKMVVLKMNDMMELEKCWKLIFSKIKKRLQSFYETFNNVRQTEEQ